MMNTNIIFETDFKIDTHQSKGRGIGTTDPGAYKLYVNGASYFNGQLTVTNLNKLAGSFQIVVEKEKGKEGLPKKGEYLAEDCFK